VQVPVFMSHVWLVHKFRAGHTFFSMHFPVVKLQDLVVHLSDTHDESH